MKKIIICTLIILLTVIVYAQQPEDTTKFPSSKTYANTNLTYKIVEASGKTWCYNIYAGSRLIIHQNSIPAIPGNKGFKTKADAEKVAKLVISKIKNGQMPPTVSVEELKKLQVIN